MSEYKRTRNIREEVTVAAGDLVDYVKRLISEGNVRRLIIRKPDGQVLLDWPLTAGAAVGGALTLVAPLLAAVGAIAALVAQMRVEIVRRNPGPSER